MQSSVSLFTKRQLASFAGIGTVLASVFKALFGGELKRVAALFTVLGQLFGAAVADRPVTPYKDSIDMSRFNLVWSDEFDHGFDTSIWQGHYVYGENDTQGRDTAWWNRSQVSFTEDGCLKLTVEYKEDGPRAAQIRDNIAAAARLFVKYCVAGDGYPPGLSVPCALSFAKIASAVVRSSFLPAIFCPNNLPGAG